MATTCQILTERGVGYQGQNAAGQASHFGVEADCCDEASDKTEGYEDSTLADDVECGFSVVGDSPTSSVLPVKLVTTSISKEDLHRHSDKAGKALRYMTKSSGDLELDQGLWSNSVGEGKTNW